jgi:uncharacterized lipoprotein YddW (UPF0748 family)
MKKVERFVRGDFVTYYDTKDYVMIPETVTEKDQETRGVWFSTVANIDFEVMKDVPSFQAYLLGVIKKVKEYHFNTIVFQVRPTNDAFYQSELNPWSRFITGTEDKFPGFDVLEWFITEAKKEKVDVHAWINPYRVSNLKFTDQNMTKEEFLNSLSEKNFARRRPDLVIETVESKLILDPTSAEVQEFVSDSALEIARNYDVKAIHIDDYFYPYEAIIDPLEEEKHQKLNPELSLADFRRKNVDKLMKMISDKLKTLDKKVEFGISPFGIYRTNSVQFIKNGLEGGWEKGSNNHHTCYQGYDGLYANVLLWMKEGWIDYVVPQVYFEFDNYIISKEDGSEIERVKYADLVDWWNWACKETNMKLFIGQGLYRYSEKGNWSNSEEIINQLKYNSTKPLVSGTIMFTYRDLVKENIPALVEARKKMKNIWTKDVLPL